MCKSPYRCGPGFFPEWVRAILSVRFNPACAAHDNSYEAGLRSREEIDEQFLDDMLVLAGWNPFWILVAYAYYAAARIGGGSRYDSYRDGEGS